MRAFPSSIPAALRAQLAALQPRARHGVLPFGDARVDDCLAEGGLALGALHEVAAGGIEAETGAVAAGFLAALLGRLPDPRPFVWIAAVADLYPPGLLGYGLDPGRILRVQASGEAALAAMESALRDGAAAAVVAELDRLGRLPARRLQLACLKRGTTGFVLRRWPFGRRAGGEEPLAAVTRWRIAPAASAGEMGAPGRARWEVTLTHARGGGEGAWIMQAGGKHDAHPLRVVAELADTPAEGGARWAG
jgi:protein ImuA